tara:strand:- start:1536 stop:1751 length:216 start_codon:yes stop_codon:yes gene_type:complete
MEILTSKRKPKKCSKCGSTKIANILYGLPDGSDEFMEDLKEGRIVLGGCCVTDDDPVWECVNCEVKIYREK